jgi:C-terminal processing protease CtpA/Prc
VSAIAITALAACGGGGGGGSSSGSTVVTPTPTPIATPPAGGGQTGNGCSLRERQNWVLSQFREWYLFPETLPANIDPAPFANVDDYVDALAAGARAQRKDRFFSYVTSIREENAFYSSGSSAGFGFRVSTDAPARRVFVTESFEGTPALAAGIDRGDEILAIGPAVGALRPVADIVAAEGSGGVTAALGPSDPGVTRVLRVAGPTGTRELTVTKADYSLTPVSPRYGSRIVDDGGKRVGYLNLRTFISSADPQLRSAFEGFRAAGISEFVIDLRYNGGGLVSIAELMGDLLGGNRSSADIFSQTTFRPEKSAENETYRFQPKPQSVSPTKIAFITTGATASASELVINGMIPYLGANLALVGANTFGKPVGQIALDRSACDDRLRIVAFSTRNGAGSDNYFNGLAGAVRASCQAPDDFTRPFGDPTEASLARALDFLAGRQCTPISSGEQGGLSLRSRPEPLVPADPTAAQREVPGLF